MSPRPDKVCVCDSVQGEAAGSSQTSYYYNATSLNTNGGIIAQPYAAPKAQLEELRIVVLGRRSEPAKDGYCRQTKRRAKKGKERHRDRAETDSDESSTSNAAAAVKPRQHSAERTGTGQVADLCRACYALCRSCLCSGPCRSQMPKRRNVNARFVLFSGAPWRRCGRRYVRVKEGGERQAPKCVPTVRKRKLKREKEGKREERKGKRRRETVGFWMGLRSRCQMIFEFPRDMHA